MDFCNRCGKAIDIRVVDGQAIPFHLDGHCSAASTGWKSLGSFAEKLEVHEQPTISQPAPWSNDICYPTKCPECGAKVFFIRHNGGSVWLDEPLGWPWPKHSCMYPETNEQPNFSSVFVGPSSTTAMDKDAPGLGVVARAAVYYRKRFSIIQVHMLDGTLRLIGLPGLHDDLCGELVFLFRTPRSLYLLTTDGLTLMVTDEEVSNPFK